MVKYTLKYFGPKQSKPKNITSLLQYVTKNSSDFENCLNQTGTNIVEIQIDEELTNNGKYILDKLKFKII